MTVLYYRIADITFKIIGDNEIMNAESALLNEYAVPPSEPDYTVIFEEADELSEPVGECVFTSSDRMVYSAPDGEIRYLGDLSDEYRSADMRMYRRGRELCVQTVFKGNFKRIGARAILNCLGIEHIMAENESFILHASYIRYGDEAVLFTAPSGVGKSTQARLWCENRGAELINGDRAAIVKKNGVFWAYGVPFAGSSGVCKNESYPIKAIVCLAQEKENTAVRLKGISAFRKLWEGCTADVWNKSDMESCIKTVSSVSAQVPVFHLGCLPDETAVTTLENEFNKLKI